VPARSMRLSDVGLAVNMIHGEGWGHTRVDLERILELSPRSNHVWESDGVSTGFVTSVVYDETAMVAHVLISKESRGRRIGKTLFKVLLDQLDSEGVKSVILYATEDGAKLYRRFGFEEAFEMLSVGLYVRGDIMRSLRGADRCLRVTAADLGQLAEMDEKAFGDNRSDMIERLHSEFPEHCFKIEEGGQVSGFVFGRRTPIGYDIGPWICTSGVREDAASLLASVIGSFPAGGRIDVSPFSDHSMANEILSEYHHYKIAEKVKLMVRGDRRYLLHAETVFGAAGFDLG
jgi:GNAT superfamily N-acetyltransferase